MGFDIGGAISGAIPGATTGAALGGPWGAAIGGGLGAFAGGTADSGGREADVRRLSLLTPEQKQLLDTTISGLLRRMTQTQQFNIPGLGKVTNQYQPMPIEQPFPQTAGLTGLQQQGIGAASNILNTAQNYMGGQRPSYTDLLGQYEPGNLGAITSQMGGGLQFDQTPYEFNPMAISGQGPDAYGMAQDVLSQPPYNTWTDKKGRPLPTTGTDPFAQALGQDAQWNPEWGPIPKASPRYTPPNMRNYSPYYQPWYEQEFPSKYNRNVRGRKDMFEQFPQYAGGGYMPAYNEGGQMHDTDYGKDLPSFADGGIMQDKDPAKDAWQLQQNLADKTHTSSKAKADQEYAKKQMDAHKQYAEGGQMPSYANGGYMTASNADSQSGSQNKQMPHNLA